ncbi:MAG: GNAT family N-acetyltransferase [Planctomycetes bacterium]|nr:GNAT family N-acetyltransferase [Planctomycetota bacterium]
MRPLLRHYDQKKDYERSEGFEAMSLMAVSDPFSTVPPPEGFSVRSLAEDNDVAAISRLLWRGFDHPSEPPHGSPEGRRFMESAPSFDKDLNVAAKAPDGTFVSYCGMWYEPVHRVAYVEPVCTDPDYRRKGLARAAVLEGIRRCGQRGATVAYVGAIKPLYLSLGFRQVYNRSAWRREWS